MYPSLVAQTLVCGFSPSYVGLRVKSQTEFRAIYYLLRPTIRPDYFQIIEQHAGRNLYGSRYRMAK